MLPGDSGTWVHDEVTNEVYGHVVASDIFGTLYVTPMYDIIEDIKSQLHAGVRLISKPSELSQVQHTPNMSTPSTATVRAHRPLWYGSYQSLLRMAAQELSSPVMTSTMESTRDVNIPLKSPDDIAREKSSVKTTTDKQSSDGRKSTHSASLSTQDKNTANNHPNPFFDSTSNADNVFPALEIALKDHKLGKTYDRIESTNVQPPKKEKEFIRRNSTAPTMSHSHHSSSSRRDIERISPQDRSDIPTLLYVSPVIYQDLLHKPYPPPQTPLRPQSQHMPASRLESSQAPYGSQSYTSYAAEEVIYRPTEYPTIPEDNYYGNYTYSGAQLSASQPQYDFSHLIYDTRDYVEPSDDFDSQATTLSHESKHRRHRDSGSQGSSSSKTHERGHKSHHTARHH